MMTKYNSYVDLEMLLKLCNGISSLPACDECKNENCNVNCPNFIKAIKHLPTVRIGYEDNSEVVEG